jgi:hypothetical protein
LLAAILTTPASAQEVELEELRGATVSVTFVRSERLLVGKQERSARFDDAMEFSFGPDDVVQVARARTTLNANPWRPKFQNLSPGFATESPTIQERYAARIGKVRKITAGHAVLIYLNGALTEIQTGSKGGRKLEIKITRTPDGLTCTARRLWMRETGADSIVGVSLRDKTPFVLVKERQISQTCRVTKR